MENYFCVVLPEWEFQQIFVAYAQFVQMFCTPARITLAKCIFVAKEIFHELDTHM